MEKLLYPNVHERVIFFFNHMVLYSVVFSESLD